MDRITALTQNLSKYDSEKLCKKCSTRVRYARNNTCVACTSRRQSLAYEQRVSKMAFKPTWVTFYLHDSDVRAFETFAADLWASRHPDDKAAAPREQALQNGLFRVRLNIDELDRAELIRKSAQMWQNWRKA